MELKDVKMVLKRIQVNYPNFVLDGYVQSEWYRELKDYCLEDVMQKLEQHFRSEQYGNSIPKVYFLTKYLKKANEKKEIDKEKILTICPLCGETISLAEFDKHHDRCCSIDYLNRKSIKLYNKEINKEKYKNMSEEEFYNIYDKFIKIVYESAENIKEKNAIKKYIYGDEDERLYNY